jgi:hypothetical protein
MSRLLTPPVSELIRTPTDTIENAIQSLCRFYEVSGNFNYLRGTKTIKSAYKGLHTLHSLLAGFDKEEVGIKANRDIVELGAPVAFGRKTQVFDLPSKKFAFGRDRLSSYRVPFFFVEDGVIKVYLLLPRKGPYLNFDHICGVGTVLTTYLLEQEFYGEKVDIEIVDLSSVIKGEQRQVRRYALADLDLWSDVKLKNQLKVVASALDRMEAEAIVKANKRVRPLKDPELPLFD